MGQIIVFPKLHRNAEELRGYAMLFADGHLDLHPLVETAVNALLRRAPFTDISETTEAIAKADFVINRTDGLTRESAFTYSLKRLRHESQWDPMSLPEAQAIRKWRSAEDSLVLRDVFGALSIVWQCDTFDDVITTMQQFVAHYPTPAPTQAMY